MDFKASVIIRNTTLSMFCWENLMMLNLQQLLLEYKKPELLELHNSNQNKTKAYILFLLLLKWHDGGVSTTSVSHSAGDDRGC